MEDIGRVANYLIKKSGRQLTNLKVNKLLYYVYGAYLATAGKPPFDEEPEAWDYGPVFPSVYHELKSYGSDPARYGFVLSDDDVEDSLLRAICDEVYRVFGGMRESELIQRTHDSNGPWAEVYDPDRKNVIIPDESIKRYFEKHVLQSA